MIDVISKQPNVSWATVLFLESALLLGVRCPCSRFKMYLIDSRRYLVNKVQQIVEISLQAKPSGATHLSTRTMARDQGMSNAMVHHIWDAHGVKPYLAKAFRPSHNQ